MQKRNDASHSFLVLSLKIVNSQSLKFRKFRMFITNKFNEQIYGNPLSCEDDVHAVAEAADGDDEHDGGDAAVDVADGVDAESTANLVDEPCDERPPAECARNDGSKAKHIEPPVLLTGIE